MSSEKQLVAAWLGLLMLGGQAGADDPAETAYQAGLRAYQEEDLITAMQVLEQAARAEHGEAQALLGYIHDKAEENDTAKRYYERAASNGSAVGAYRLGAMYASGDGVPRDSVAAVNWFRQAADADYGPALETLGLAYIEGALGLAQDQERGLELLRRAAAEGYEPARVALDRLAAGQVAK